jgi:hypothetical protein
VCVREVTRWMPWTGCTVVRVWEHEFELGAERHAGRIELAADATSELLAGSTKATLEGVAHPHSASLPGQEAVFRVSGGFENIAITSTLIGVFREPLAG